MNARQAFECVALLLQGGGALGSYQAGVYQALAEVNLHPDWVAGISIGAINSALIAGNPPERRVEALRAFWEEVTEPPEVLPSVYASLMSLAPWGSDQSHHWLNQMRAFATIVGGAPGFFQPRAVPPFSPFAEGQAAESFYDTGPLRTTLERLIDFDRINAGPMRFSVGAVNVCNGNFAYFDTTTHVIRPEHILASGALPPGFPSVEIDGEHYWDGGLISNTPLQWVLENEPRQNTLAFQVDLWSARGSFPETLANQDMRLKDIRFSSRTRAMTDQFRRLQSLRRAFRDVIQLVPEAARAAIDPETLALFADADDKVYNIVHLIYRTKSYEDSSKDYEFSRATMEEHWACGYRDALRNLQNPRVFQHPQTRDGVTTFDLAETTANKRK